jgi:glycerol kinase
LQADILGVAVVRPTITETTSLGAAYTAGLACGIWNSTDTLRGQWRMDREWLPQWSADRREAAYRGWQKAVSRSLDWL